MKRVILWFRQDLRLHDNEALTDALDVADELIPVFVFDSRLYRGGTIYGFNKIGEARTRFIVESVEDLRRNLRFRGSELIVRHGQPEEEIIKIADAVKSSWVYCNRERTPDEVSVQDALERNLWTIGQEMRYSRGKMLYYTSDLPYPVTHTPDNFISFRKETEKFVKIRKPLETPHKLPHLQVKIEIGQIPSVGSLIDQNASGSDKVRLAGGEEQAFSQLALLKEELQRKSSEHDNSVNNKLHVFSPWLAQGCLSPKLLYELIRENQQNQAELARQIFTGLLYRDHLRLMVKKHGQSVFEENGIKGEGFKSGVNSNDLLQIWIDGKTGHSIVDSAMKQLSRTGFIDVRQRKLSALYLIRELDVHWRMGASYFESTLIDYDGCSNWANWCNLAGVGPDAREFRNTGVSVQSKHVKPETED